MSLDIRLNTTNVEDDPRAAGFYMPAEWSRHARCWMCWPDNPHWGRGLNATERGYAAVAKAIRRFEPVSMVVNSAAKQRASSLCGPDIDLVCLPIDDAWMRDSGPSFLKHADGRLGATAWHFNAWGGVSSVFQRDDDLAVSVCRTLDVAVYQSSLTLEGGAIHIDGEGTLVTTESVVLNPNRNPGVSKEQATEELCRALGVEQVIWMPGDPQGLHADVTDGHIDGIMCFVEPGRVIFESAPNATEAAAELDQANLRALQNATDARGRRLEIIHLHDATEAAPNRELFCRSYVNFYLSNGGLVMPAYGIASDDEAREVLHAAFPDRDIVQVDINAIAPQGGGIHCITQQQPELDSSAISARGADAA